MRPGEKHDEPRESPGFSGRRWWHFRIGVDGGRSAFCFTVLADSEAKPSAPRLHKAVKFSMVGGRGSLTDKFKMVKDAGFEGIDIDRHLDHDEVRRAKEESGLVVHGVVGYDHWR